MAIPHVNNTAAVTRFANGLTNVMKGTTCQNLAAPDPTRLRTFFDDFTSAASADILATTPLTYTVTSVGTGSIAINTTVPGGVINIVTGATSANSEEYQSKFPSFQFVKTQRTILKYNFEIADVTNSSIVLGLQVINTTPTAANTEGLYFTKASGAATGIVSLSNGTATTSSTAFVTLIASTMTSIGFEYDPYKVSDTGTIGCICLYVNDVQQPQKLPITNMGVTNLLAPVIYIGAGTAAAQTLQLDYVLVSQERPTNAVL